MTGWPVAASHTRAVPSPHAVANRFPPGSNTAWLAPAASSTVTAELPTVVTSQSRAVESEPTVNTCEPSGVNRARSNDSAVVERGRQWLAGRRVPDPRRTVISGRGDPAAVGAEAGVADGDRMTHRARCRA